MNPKKIIHVDMDCFFAQVEMRDNPKLKNLPIAVGGLPKTRSVLCTSNYEARKFGVKSAMPTDFAIRKCPHLIVIPPNFSKYQEASEAIHSVFLQFTNLIEPISLDEAYLDVSSTPNATHLLKEIKDSILKKTQLTCSVGLAPNKFLAKIASDWKKPDGEFIIKPHQVNQFVEELDVRLIPGIGPKSLEILKSLNIYKCRDLRKFDVNKLIHFFGKFAHQLVQFANGIDDREVINLYERKTLSVENTFSKDYFWGIELEEEFLKVMNELQLRLTSYFNEHPNHKVKKIFAKARFNDFSRTTTEIIIVPVANFNSFDYLEKFKELLLSNLTKKDMPIRLIGLGVRFHPENETNNGQQLTLFAQPIYE
jgi:DNA polymerase-4